MGWLIYKWYYPLMGYDGTGLSMKKKWMKSWSDPKFFEPSRMDLSFRELQNGWISGLRAIFTGIRYWYYGGFHSHGSTPNSMVLRNSKEIGCGDTPMAMETPRGVRLSNQKLWQVRRSSKISSDSIERVEHILSYYICHCHRSSINLKVVLKITEIMFGMVILFGQLDVRLHLLLHMPQELLIAPGVDSHHGWCGNPGTQWLLFQINVTKSSI